MTDTAKAILGCVKTSWQRYGTTVIIDTVHGANTVKIRNYRMNENPYYGTLSKVPAYRLRKVMQQLQLEEYLFVTNDEYAIVKLTKKSDEVLCKDKQIIMKMAKEQERIKEGNSEKEKKSKKRKSPGFSGQSAIEFGEKEEALFGKLRSLRMEIAREENVPPYIVFSDKTLTHMCLIKPKTKEEMMQVSGVGEFKYEKYGERFLSCIVKSGL